MEYCIAGLVVGLVANTIYTFIIHLMLNSEEDYNRNRRRQLSSRVDHLELLPELEKQIEEYKEYGGERTCIPEDGGIKVLYPEGVDWGMCIGYHMHYDLDEFRLKVLLPLLREEEK